MEHLGSLCEIKQSQTVLAITVWDCFISGFFENKASQNFIVDVTQVHPGDALIEEQIQKIFRMKETSFVDEIVIINDGKIVRVAKRA